MDRKKITIVTGTGGELGTGHYQRMLNLALALNSSGKFSTVISLQRKVYPPHSEFANLFTDNVPDDTGLIIRDMRDSERDDILTLKSIAPVLVIDDSGDGRRFADYALNILPLPSEGSAGIKPESRLFIYGYNFTAGIDSLKISGISDREIDLTVYAGYNPADEIVSSIKESVPSGAKSVLLAAGSGVALTGVYNPQGLDYAGILSRSKILVTHFGLTMYEGDACGCSIIALNPTHYHSRLTDTVSGEFRIIYSSLYHELNRERLSASIEHELKNYIDKKISPADTLARIAAGTNNFIAYIESLLK